MMCDIKNIDCDFGVFVDKAQKIGDENMLKVHVMHEDIFNSMHKI
jgi:ACT domain-containing protein